MHKKILLFIIGLIIAVFGFDFFTLSGTYFFLDTIFYPIYKLQGFFEQTFYWHIRDILTIILGYELYSKIFFLGIILVGSLLGYKIGTFINTLLKIKNKNIQLFNILSGITFITLNPFTYERFITQTGIILGIYLIGIGFIFLIEFLLQKKYSTPSKKLYFSSLFFGLSLTIFPHSVIFLIIIFLITLIFYIRKFSIKNIFLSLFIVFIINSNWIVGNIFFGTKSNVDKINTFDYKNIEVFMNNSLNNLGVEFTNLLLYGFWGEKYKHLSTPDLMNEKWYISGFIIICIIFLGIIFLYKKQRKLTLYLLCIGIISYILSLGISSEIFKDINLFLYHNVPYYIGMREPQKLTGLLMIIYSLFFITGIQALIYIIKKIKLHKYLNNLILSYYTGFILLFLIIIAWSPNVLFGFNHQLRIGNYPQSFFEARSFLLQKYQSEKALILPWHSYIGCNWTQGKVVSNIIPSVLSPLKIISADNIEIGGLYTNHKNIQSTQIELFLKNKDYTLLKNLGIKNIIFLNNCADFKKYSYLKIDKDKNIKKIFNSDDIQIYKIK